jgi:hypothetical protein
MLREPTESGSATIIETLDGGCRAPIPRHGLAGYTFATGVLRVE